MKLRRFVCAVSPFNFQWNEVANASIYYHFAGVARFYYVCSALSSIQNGSAQNSSDKKNKYAMNKNAA